MSDEQFGFGAVDFRVLLLDLYKKLGIADKEALVLLMVDHLGLQGNKLITASDLSFKMSMPVEELDSILASLLKRDLISINGGVTSVAPLREKLLAQFKQELAKAKASPISKKRAEALGRLRDYAEKRFNRTLAVEWAYAKPYASEAERAAAYETWLHHYNHHRPHTGIGGQTPSARVHNVTGKYT